MSAADGFEPDSLCLVPVDETNWQAVADVRPTEAQHRFVRPVSWYLAQMKFDGIWTCLGVEAGEAIVGHVMLAHEAAEDTTWIGGLVVDRAHQRRGLGRQVVAVVLARIRADGVANAGLTYAPDNDVARRLYAGFGFVETGEFDDDEIVARLALP